MRIAMIDPSLFTLPYDQALAGGLVACGHDVTLYGRQPGRDDGDARLPVVPAFYRLANLPRIAALPGPLRLGVKGLDHAWSMARLPARLRRQRADMIHFQWLPLPLVDRLSLARLRRIAPLVLTVHDTDPFNGNPSSRLQSGGFLGCLARFDRLIVHTEQGAARLRARGLADRLAVLPHGILGGTPPERRAPDPMQGPVTFTLFGKLKPYKGADTLIAAFALVPPALRAQARLRIVGKPYMDLAPLHALAAASGLEEQVTIEPRFVADAEISDIFGPGTVAVFPYRAIDSSGVLTQALAHGRPVVASRLGGFAEVLTDGVQGHLAAADDVPAFAAALTHLLADRLFAAGCARAALALADGGASWEAIARQTEAVYADAARAYDGDGTARTASGSVVSRGTVASMRTRKITGGNSW
jgi:glycosyltransferase involved in cell wall biosynthesis